MQIANYHQKVLIPFYKPVSCSSLRLAEVFPASNFLGRMFSLLQCIRSVLQLGFHLQGFHQSWALHSLYKAKIDWFDNFNSNTMKLKSKSSNIYVIKEEENDIFHVLSNSAKHGCMPLSIVVSSIRLNESSSWSTVKSINDLQKKMTIIFEGIHFLSNLRNAWKGFME